MLTPNEFNALLSQRKTVIIDGALATELETRGHNLNHPLWSGKILKNSPSVIAQVHKDYYLAGADIAITASYQTSTVGLKQHLDLTDDEAITLIKQSSILAQQARSDAYTAGVTPQRNLLVAGSVGPYGAYLANGAEYTGEYGSITHEELKTFHRPRIHALVESGVDILAIETIPQLGEINAILDLLAEEFPSTIAWLSCTLKDDQRISDGTDVSQVLDTILLHNKEQTQIVAFGVNCVAPNLALKSLENVAAWQKQSTERTLPLLCYPNSGESYDATTKQWGEDSDLDSIEGLVQKLQSAGVSLIGGCCRTGPPYVQAVAASVSNTFTGSTKS